MSATGTQIMKHHRATPRASAPLAAQPRASRAGIPPRARRVGWIAGALLLVAATALVGGCGHAAVPVAGATLSPTPAGTPTASAEPEITTIAALVARYGEPPDAAFARMKIPVIGVDAPVGRFTVGAGGVMPAPTDPVEVAWYDLAAFSGLGGVPGAGGNAIFAAHVDEFAHIPYAGRALFRGKAVFGSLALLSPGDVIEIDYQGRTLRYAVTWERQVTATGADWRALLDSHVAVDSITLYTCSGDFNWSTREYSDRLVVRAERVR
jgi:sortase (surface protein transpeptidase)